MALMDELKNAPTNQLGGTGKAFIDADTLVDEKLGEKYRIQGIDAGEVEKIVGGKYKTGTAGGAQTTDTIRRLANEQGYTNVVPVIDPSTGKPQRDDFGRIISDLTNDKGQSFKTSLLEAGAFDINKYTTEEDIAASEIANARRRQQTLDGDYTATAFDQAAIEIKQAELGEGAKQQGFKATLLNEAQRAQAIAAGQGHRIANNVQVRNYDRDLNNKSLNPFSDSWEQGWTGVSEAAYGALNMLGETTGWEAAANIGEDGIIRKQAELGQYGSTIIDYKEVDGFATAVEYLGNNLALSLPYMVGISGAAVAGSVAAPVVGAVGAGAIAIGAPAAIYAGQTWNEMEGEKNAAVAIGAGIAQATLDRLGLAAIFKKGVPAEKLLNKAVDKLTSTGMTREVAEATVAKASRQELAGFLGDAGKIAKQQIAAKEIFKQLGGRAAIASGTEGITEAAQEGTAYLAAVYGSDKEFNFDDLNNRLISAAIAGSALGGGLSVPASVYDAGAWADVAYRLEPASQAAASEAELYAAEEKDKYGRVASIEELAADASNRATSIPGAALDDRAAAHKSAQSQKSAIDRATEEALNVSQLWQGATRNIFTPELKRRSRTARIMADMFGGSLQRTFSGSNFESSKFHRVAVYKNMVAEPNSFYQKITGRGRTFASEKASISKNIYEQLNRAVDHNGEFAPHLVAANATNRREIIELGKQLKTLGDRLYADQAKHNPDLGYIKNYLSKYKAVNKGAVANNRAGFIQALQKNGYSREDASKLTDEIIDNNEVADIDEAFSVTKGGIVPAAHRKRALGMSEKAEFQDFMEQDIFANIAQATKSAARYTAHRDYIGKNAGVVSKLLDDMQAEGVPESEVNKVAAQMKNYLDAESGNYKRPSSDLGKKAQRIQKNFMMLTTLAGLPLATISSFVETMLINKGLRKDQIFGKQGSLRQTGEELAKTLWDGTKFATTGGFAKESKLNNRQEILKDLGFYEWDVGAATVTGVSEVNPWQQWVYEEFFKWTGLSGFTNFTRAARAGIAQDFMTDKVETIAVHRRSGEPRTREIQEAEEGLRNLGIDVDQYVEVHNTKMAGLPLTPEQNKFMEGTTREATFNFVNEAIALPQSANRPLIYQDPRFALFTQFQGFMATFTANHIPKLWGEYVKRGTPAMKYNAFALATTMIAMGFASQYLKDLLKYGESTPHLEGAEYIQRGVRASGLLGTSERVLDQFFPIYEQRTDGVGDWVFKTGSGESPALSTFARAAKGAGAAIEGDFEKGAYYGLKSAPIVGPFTDLNKRLAQGLTGGGWNFKGEQ